MNDARAPHTHAGSVGWIRIAVFVIALAVVVYWVSTSDGDSAAFVRSFLRNLFRQLF